MLCSRSASLMTSTRRSRAIATSILRIVAACWASRESNWMRSSLVTPSTIAATSAPKSRLDVGERDLGVLDGVVEQRGGDRDLVEADVGDDAGHGQRVVDVALAAGAQLAAVGLGGDLVGAVDRGHRRLRVAAAVAGEQRRQLGRRRRLVVAPPGQDAVDGAHGRLSTRQDLDAAVAERGPAARARRSRSGSRSRRSTPPSASTSRAVAAAVPPVASTSSIDQHPLVGMDGVAVDLQLVGAVLELVLLADDGPRQLAGLAHRARTPAPRR